MKWFEKTAAIPERKSIPGRITQPVEPVEAEEPTESDAPAEVERLQKELSKLRENYKHLHAKSERDLEESRQQMIYDLDKRLRSAWEMTSGMIEMVMRGEREPKHLANIWNRLNSAFWKEIMKQNGYPIKIQED
jgi:hypothetical protein